MSSYRLQKQQTRDSQKLFQLPPHNAHPTQEKPQFQQDHLSELSNVEQKSYIESEASGHDKQDIQQFIANIKTGEVFDEPSSPTRKASPSNIRRIEDHDIIVVQEQNEIGSNSAGKESVILEHIEFNSGTKLPEETPEWEHYHNNYKHEGVSYTINCVEATHHFLVHQHQYASSSTPNDFDSTEIKDLKARNSKNTCIQRTDSRDSNHVKNFRETNKSCIAKPMNRVNSKESESSPQSSNQLDLNQILNKWNNYIYPELSSEYLRKEARQQEEREKKTYYQMQKQAKYCISESPNSRLRRMDDFSELKSSNSKEDKEVQTESTDVVRNLEEKLQRYEVENNMMIESQIKMERELASLRESLELKKVQIQKLRNKHEQENQSRARLYIEESKRIQSRNRELQKNLNERNLAISAYQQKQNVLQKKLHETVSYLQKHSQLQPIQLKSMKIQKFNTFGTDLNTKCNFHEACTAKIQLLQQHIFDMEQERVGIQLQVEKRLNILTKQIEVELRKTLSEQFEKTLASLKQENSELKNANASINSQRKEMVEKWQKRESELNQKQQRLKKMYDQINECKEVDRSQQTPKSPTASNKYSVMTSINANRCEQAFNKTPSGECFSHSASLLKNKFFSSKNIFSPSNKILNFNEATALERDASFRYFKESQSTPPTIRSNHMENIKSGYERMTFGRQAKYKLNEIDQNYEMEENQEFHVINSKIERLRSQINRQLDLIH